MKKLIIAMTVVAIGVVAHAASWNWSCTSNFFDGTGTTDKMSDGTTVYLMFTSSYSLSDIVSDFAAGGIATSKAIDTATISNAKIGEGQATANVTADQTAYLAVVYGERLFISSTSAAEYLEVGSADLAFASQAYLTRYNNTSATLLVDKMASSGYAGAGWYQAASVPEPTSGLLLLLGMAGLALKRKKA